MGTQHVWPVTLIAVVLYLLTSYFCWRLVQDLASTGGASRSEVFVWRTLVVLFVLLAIFRGAEFQPRVIDYGRDTAQIQGWYAFRHSIQPYVIAAILLVSLVAAGILLKSLRGLPTITQLAVGATLAIVTYIAVRTVSLHFVDAIAHQRILGLRLSWIFEGSALLAIMLATIRRRAMTTTVKS